MRRPELCHLADHRELLHVNRHGETSPLIRVHLAVPEVEDLVIYRRLRAGRG
jgi:hypothetical protein